MPMIALAGDVMLGRGVSEVLRRSPDPAEVWGDVLPLLREADLRVVNLECAITAHERPWTRTPKLFHFRADPGAVACLVAAGIDVCSLANNHVVDFEATGLLDTLRHLDAAGIAHAGAGRDLEEARRPAFIDTGGTRVAVVAWTDNEPAFGAGPDRPGTHYLPVSLEAHVLERVAAVLDRARAEADLVIATVHWGPNMVQRPSDRFRRFARAVIDQGADLFHGHSAHVFQGVELHRGRPILYDTGDFLDDYAVDPVLRNDWSFLFRARFDGRRFTALELVPVTLPYAAVRLATGEAREAMMRRMATLSEEMGARLERREGRLWLEV